MQVIWKEELDMWLSLQTSKRTSQKEFLSVHFSLPRRLPAEPCAVGIPSRSGLHLSLLTHRTLFSGDTASLWPERTNYRSLNRDAVWSVRRRGGGKPVDPPRPSHVELQRSPCLCAWRHLRFSLTPIGMTSIRAPKPTHSSLSPLKPLCSVW